MYVIGFFQKGDYCIGKKRRGRIKNFKTEVYCKASPASTRSCFWKGQLFIVLIFSVCVFSFSIEICHMKLSLSLENLNVIYTLSCYLSEAVLETSVLCKFNGLCRFFCQLLFAYDRCLSLENVNFFCAAPKISLYCFHVINVYKPKFVILFYFHIIYRKFLPFCSHILKWK